jgi:adenosylhomocysteine nucleosidase
VSLGIVSAMPGELSTLTRERLPMGGCRLLREGAWVALAGIGPRRAMLAGADLLSRGTTALISWGTAAALDPALPAGALVVPRRVIGADGMVYLVDTGWHRRLIDRLAERHDVHDGALAESRELLRGPEEKRRLFRETSAEAADMESAALARLAWERGIPFCVVRAIVDPADFELPRCIPNAVGRRGQVLLARLLARAVLHPGDWRRLSQLGRHFHAAREKLTRVISTVGLETLGPDPGVARASRP